MNRYPVPHPSPYRTRLIVPAHSSLVDTSQTRLWVRCTPSRENPNTTSRSSPSTPQHRLDLSALRTIRWSAHNACRIGSALQRVDRRAAGIGSGSCRLGGAIMTGASVTVLRTVAGVALKHALDAWAVAPGPDKAARSQAQKSSAGSSGASTVSSTRCSVSRSPCSGQSSSAAIFRNGLAGLPWSPVPRPGFGTQLELLGRC
jgi:hypothetical protein